MRKLYEQDIIEILYGATLLGAGGGGSLKQGLGMLDGLKKDGNAIEVDLLDLDEIGDNEYAAVVCGLGSPVAMLDPSKPAFGPDAVHAFKAFQKAFIAEGKEVKYLQSGEMGGFNTFTPMLVAILSDKDPAKLSMPVLSAACFPTAFPIWIAWLSALIWEMSIHRVSILASRLLSVLMNY